MGQGGGEDMLTFLLHSSILFDLLWYWNYVTVVQPSKRSAPRKENWGTSEGKKEKSNYGILPRRQVLDLREQSGLQPNSSVKPYSPKHGRQTEVKGKEQEGHFYLGPDSGSDFRKEQVEDVKQKRQSGRWGRVEWRPGLFSITLM